MAESVKEAAVGVLELAEGPEADVAFDPGEAVELVLPVGVLVVLCHYKVSIC